VLSCRSLLLSAAALATAIACGGTTSEQVVSPTGVRCQLGLTAPATPLPASGSSVSLNVDVPRDCSWAASTDAPWLSISPASGQGTAVLSVAVTANAQPSPRSASIVVNESTVVVRQEPAPCRFELSHQGTRFGSEGGRISVRVSTIDGCESTLRVITDPGCGWAASSGSSWLTVSRASGTGPDTLPYQASANTSTVNERTGTLVVAGRTHRVTQQPCDLSLDASTPGFGPEGGTSWFRVNTGSGCTWSANTDVDWLGIVRVGGPGSGDVHYSVAPNPTSRDRSGRITVSGRTKVVIQQALGQGG